MTTIQDQSVQQLQQQQGAASIIFNHLTPPAERMGEVSQAIENFRTDFGFNKPTIGTNDLKSLLEQARQAQESLKDLELALQHEILPRSMAQVESWISTIIHPDCPTLGQDFIRQMQRANCKTVIKQDQSFPAIYTSYSYAPHNRGFANEVGLDPHKGEDVSSLGSSIVHEIFHPLQTHASEALHYSPFNPDTRVIVHPMDWIMLENLCERDAYAKQALFNFLLSQLYPNDYRPSSLDVVTAEEMEQYLLRSESLQEALTEAAYWSLTKDTKTPAIGFTFEDHYHQVALKNYTSGMDQRSKAGESGFVFVRLTPEDYHAIGDYSVGPNSLGHQTIDDRFLLSKELLPGAQETLDTLCRKYNIPDLVCCMTLREHIEQEQKKATASSTVAYSSSTAVHAPFMA